MDRRRSTVRRVVALAAGALLGLLPGPVVAGPATAQSAQPGPAQPGPALVGDCEWDATATEWVVSWTLTPPADAGHYRLTGVEWSPTETTLTGIRPTDGTGHPHHPDTPLSGEQRVPAEATAASLTVRAESSTADTTQWSGSVTIPEDCARPEPPELIGDVSYDCDTLTITIENPLDETVRLTLVPDDGGRLDVEVAGGESAKLQVPATEGRSVDVRYHGHSVVDPADPIGITAEQWAALECPADDEPSDLAATGPPVVPVVVGALALLGLGGGLYLVARRRVRFTA